MIKKRISSTEIAKLAHVSRSTVSRVINNYSNVPEETREKVMKVIEQMEYYPNNSAQILAGKQTKCIGLFWILHEPLTENFASNVFIVSVIWQATKMGYSVLTHVVENMSDVKNLKKIKAAFVQGRIEGAVFIGCNAEEPFLDELVKEGYYVSILEEDVTGHDEPNRIIVNFDEQATEDAVSYLVQLGHRKIGLLYGTLKRYGGIQKYRGYRNGFLKNGIDWNEEWIRCCEFSEVSGYETMKKLLNSSTDLPTAFCCANDLVAFGAIKALKEAKISIPEQISIIGLDDHVGSSSFSPALTTFYYDLRGMMYTLTRELILAIEDNQNSKIKHFEYHAELVERESCRKI